MRLQGSVNKPSARKPKKRSFALLFTVVYGGVLIAAVTLNRLVPEILAFYLLASLVTFVVYAWDKSAARGGRWRISESTLHILDLIGGWPGGLAAQRLLRHKSSKQAFLSVFWATVLVNVFVIAYLAWQGEANPINQLLNTLF